MLEKLRKIITSYVNWVSTTSLKIFYNNISKKKYKNYFLFINWLFKLLFIIILLPCSFISNIFILNNLKKNILLLIVLITLYIAKRIFIIVGIILIIIKIIKFNKKFYMEKKEKIQYYMNNFESKIWFICWVIDYYTQYILIDYITSISKKIRKKKKNEYSNK